MKLIFLVLYFFALFLFFPKSIVASENQFINIVNPIRITEYSVNPALSLKSQYGVVSTFDLPATWLLTYDAIKDEEVREVLKSFDEKQELGIFLEVSKRLAESAGVDYNKGASWHHASNIFLTGYKQEERIRIIDTVFESFNDLLGYYPESIGSWWTDAFSLSYIQEKYKITANLGLADQYSTDGYQVWGTYWEAPYFPSKLHAGIPAGNESTKIDLVTIQWAPRDPLNGYYSSLYSTQDYKVAPRPQETDYFEKLVRFYLEGSDGDFGQVTVGLESDLAPEAYNQEFKKQVQIVKKLADEGRQVVTMKQFGEWYKKYFNVTPTTLIQSEDFLGSGKRVFWYQSSKVRVGIVYDSNSKETKVIDLRTYQSDFQEPYYYSPNRQLTLSIYIPSYFDEVNNNDDVWLMNMGELLASEIKGDRLFLNFSDGRILLNETEIQIEKSNVSLPKRLVNNPLLKVEKQGKVVKIYPTEKYIVGPEGYLSRGFTEGTTRYMVSKRFYLIAGFVAFVILATFYKISFSTLSLKEKFGYLSMLVILISIFTLFWYFKNSEIYYVSQSEVDALLYLRGLPDGKVLVYDKECLGCEWNTTGKPAVFANKRSYIQNFGNKRTVVDQEIFETRERTRAKELFNATGAKYIYLAAYEGYKENMPFSPGDLGVEKIYSNANGEVWRVK